MVQHRALPRHGRRLLIVLALALSACAPGRSAHVEDVQVADEFQVRGCTHLKDVSRTEGLRYRLFGRVSGEYAQTGLEKAQAEVLREAKELGATHVVWSPKEGTAESSRVSAKAYRCGPQERSR